MNELKILTIGDAHGVIPRRAPQLVKKNSPDIIICTGDLANSDAIRKIIFLNWHKLSQGMTVEDIVGRKRYIGMVKAAVSSMDVILKYLNSLGKPVYLIYGNNDYPQKELNHYDIKVSGIEKQAKRYKNTKLMVNSIARINGYALIGVSGYRGSMSKKDPDKSLLHKFEKSFRKAKKHETIFFYHDNPYRTKLDLVRNKASPLDGKHIGEPFVNVMIKKHKPLLYLCGHMHENVGAMKLGKTLCLNTGLVAHNDYFIVTLKNKHVSVKKV